MEIIPGVGVSLVHVGDQLKDVEARIGPPHAHQPGASRRVYPAHNLVVDYDEHNRAELVTVAGGTGEGEQASLAGVQLTNRQMTDVIDDLDALGYTRTPCDIGYDFHAGFAVFSMNSAAGSAIDSEGTCEPPMVEGVAIAPYSYFAS